ncbi:MAG: metal ABC transporter substrate-binding protein [Eubacteriales bacterium]|nr:metal ABC transporter substrate-binding protein [Eubacteriales bacterium]
MKRMLAVMAALALLFSQAATAQEKKLRVITTIFPAYDFARQVGGDDVEVTLLLPPGSESHTYEPTPQDVIAIQNADLFINNGGESDAWVRNVLDSMGEKAPKTLAMMDCVDKVEEELTGAMEGEAEAGELDEHVWTAPRNAMTIAAAIADTLAQIDPERAQRYADRNAAYQAQLQTLDGAFRAVVEAGTRKTIVFGDRFPLRYFVDEFGLSYDAAFPGCSEDAEPSVQTLIKLIKKVREEQIPVVFHIEFSSCKTADAIAEETGAKVLLFHSCHNIGADELAAGATYVSLMTANAAALEEALN